MKIKIIFSNKLSWEEKSKNFSVLKILDTYMFDIFSVKPKVFSIDFMIADKL